MLGIKTRTTISEKWVLFFFLVQVRDFLVPTDIERTDDDRTTSCCPCRLGVNGKLLFLGRRIFASKEDHFRPEQSDSIGAIFESKPGVLAGCCIGGDLDLLAIGSGRNVGRLLQASLTSHL